MQYLIYYLKQYGMSVALIFGAIFGLYRLTLHKRFKMKTRLNRLKEVLEVDEDLDELSFSDKIEQFLRGDTLYKVPLIGPFYKKQMNSLIAANVQLKPKEYFIITLTVPLILFIISWILTRMILAAIGIAIMGFMAPNIYISFLKSKRQKDMEEQLPEFLNILSNGVRAGLSLNQGMAIAIEEIKDPIHYEFSKLLHELNLGRSLQDALLDLGARAQNESIDIFVMSVTIQREIGGNLSEILDIIAETIRERLKLKRHINSVTSQNKMSALVVGLLPLGIAGAIAVISPGYMDPLFTDPRGQILLGIMVVMMITGMYLLKKITEVSI